MKKFYCLTIDEDQHEKFSDALADALCWLEGFQQGGGTYSPGSLEQLREFRIKMRQANHSTN